MTLEMTNKAPGSNEISNKNPALIEIANNTPEANNVTEAQTIKNFEDFT